MKSSDHTTKIIPIDIRSLVKESVTENGKTLILEGDSSPNTTKKEKILIWPTLRELSIS